MNDRVYEKVRYLFSLCTVWKQKVCWISKFDLKMEHQLLHIVCFIISLTLAREHGTLQNVSLQELQGFPVNHLQPFFEPFGGLFLLTSAIDLIIFHSNTKIKYRCLQLVLHKYIYVHLNTFLSFLWNVCFWNNKLHIQDYLGWYVITKMFNLRIILDTKGAFNRLRLRFSSYFSRKIKFWK